VTLNFRALSDINRHLYLDYRVSCHFSL